MLMVDKLTKDRRSWNMSRIHSKNTKPEIKVRSELHKLGYRFRIHKNELPGKPDIVLPKYKKIIFVHGCFWHNHKNCKKSGIPKSNIDFWEDKINKNVIRDSAVVNKLTKSGWDVYIIWECETEDDDLLKSILSDIFKIK